MSSLMPDQKPKEEIDRLISSGAIQYDSGLIGCCIRYYLKFPNDNHKYYYKPDEIIANTLKTKVLSHSYTMSKKPLHENKPLLMMKVIVKTSTIQFK